MKRILSLIAVLAVCLTVLAGCGSKNVMYNGIDFDDYVKLPKYKNIEIDKNSDKYKEYYDDIFQNDVKQNKLFIKKTTGTVADGDTVNIDYVGRKDGVAFEGGTASDYSLEIGSGTFIDGFESGLIGKNIGDTVDLNLRFPDGYQSEELAGKDVVFTVTINYVNTAEGQNPANVYKELNYKSLAAYEKDIENRAIENFLIYSVVDNAKIIKYPENDVKLLLDNYKDKIEDTLNSEYKVDLKTYISSMNMTEKEFDERITEQQVKPAIDYQMPLYAVFNKEGMSVDSKDIDAKIDELIAESGNPSLTADTLKEYYGDYYFENLVVRDKVVDFLKKKANIK